MMGSILLISINYSLLTTILLESSFLLFQKYACILLIKLWDIETQANGDD